MLMTQFVKHYPRRTIQTLFKHGRFMEDLQTFIEHDKTINGIHGIANFVQFFTELQKQRFVQISFFGVSSVLQVSFFFHIFLLLLHRFLFCFMG